MNDQQEQELCGIFGKVPQQSDFVSHHLPESFTEYWHEWLQASMSISREQLGEPWLEQYIVSPVWYFALMPNIAHAQSVVGVVIPSVDEIGRYFPLTLAHIGDHDVWSAYLNGGDWYSEVEQVALMALADEVSYSELVGALENLSLPAFGALPEYQAEAPNQALPGNSVIKTNPETSPSDFALSLLPKAHTQRYGAHSLWWTRGSESFEPAFAINTKLPDPGQFASFLNGEWQTWGWLQESPVEDNR